MSDCYVIKLANTSVAAGKTLIWINPGTTRHIEIIELGLSQSGSTTAAMQRVQLVTQITAFPTLALYTPVPMQLGTTSAIIGGTDGSAGKCGVNASAEGAGTKTVLLEDAFNVLNGWRWVPGPDGSILLPASAAYGFGLYLPAMVATLTMNAYLVYRER